MYSFTPTKNNKTARGVSVCLFLAAAVLFLSPTLLSLPYKVFWQLGGIACLVGGIAILTRFVFKSFRYDVVSNGEGLDFTVTELQGRGNVTVCRIAVSNIEKLLILKRGECANEGDLRERRRFSYVCEMLSEEECLIFATECGEKLLIKITPDKELIRILSPEE